MVSTNLFHSLGRAILSCFFVCLVIFFDENYLVSIVIWYLEVRFSPSHRACYFLVVEGCSSQFVQCCSQTTTAKTAFFVNVVISLCSLACVQLVF